MLGDCIQTDERHEEHTIVVCVRGLENSNDMPSRLVNVGCVVWAGHAMRRAKSPALLFVFFFAEIVVIKTKMEIRRHFAANDGLKFSVRKHSSGCELITLATAILKFLAGNRLP